MRGLSLVAASGGHSSSRCAGLSLSRPLLLRSTGSRRAGSVVVAHGPSRSAACGIFPDQGSNPCPLHWQADSQPLRHQGSPVLISDTIIRARTVHINKSSLGASVICKSTKGILRPKCLRTAIPWCRTQQRGKSGACSHTQPREKARRGKQAFFSGREPSRGTLGMTHTQSFPALPL